MKKTISILLVATVLLMGVFASGAEENKATTKDDSITIVCRASYANENWFNNMNAAFEEATGIHVIVQPTPGNDDDHDVKVNIDLLAGSNIDVIPSLGPKYYSDRAEAGYFMALDDLFATKGIDEKAVWGQNLPVSSDGHIYGIPAKQEMYCVFYNKDLFDKAGVAYPNGEWSWEEFEETALKLSDPENGVYGSYMNIENPWLIIQAKQKDVPLYKEDGTCNFDDPAFAEALEWYKKLGDEGAQMPVKEMVNENVSWNYYAMAGDHLAMFLQGNWFTRLLNDQEGYPKDWKYGVTQVPDGGEGSKNNFVSMGYYSVNKNAKNPDGALEYCLWVGQNGWKYEGQVPALASLTEEEQNQVFGSIASASNGQVTANDLYEAWINTGLGAVESDIIGEAANEYNRIANEEAQAYCMGLQTIETTITNICNRVNEAIKNVQ